MAGYSQGEKVKVTFEGTVEATPNDEWVGVRLDDGLIHWVHADERVAKVERVEPEYGVFGPGDVVRERNYETVRVLADSGYIIVGRGGFFDYGTTGFEKSWFTSKHHERVEV